MLAKLARPGQVALPPRSVLLAGGAVALTVLWVFWPTLRDLLDKWGTDPQYSHGYLVPLFALYLLWARREQRSAEPGEQAAAPALQPTWWGLPLLAAGLACR